MVDDAGGWHQARLRFRRQRRGRTQHSELDLLRRRSLPAEHADDLRELSVRLRDSGAAVDPGPGEAAVPVGARRLRPAPLERCGISRSRTALVFAPPAAAPPREHSPDAGRNETAAAAPPGPRERAHGTLS